MMRLVSVAIRNVLRNKRRSLFSGLAMIIGVAFVVFLTASTADAATRERLVADVGRAVLEEF